MDTKAVIIQCEQLLNSMKFFGKSLNDSETTGSKRDKRKASFIAMPWQMRHLICANALTKLTVFSSGETNDEVYYCCLVVSCSMME